MKKILTLTGLLIIMLFVSCSKDENEVIQLPVKINYVENIESKYDLGLHEFLKISPKIEFENFNEEDVKYEWIINEENVSTEKDLAYKCQDLGSFEGTFKVSTPEETKFFDFNIYVSSPYDVGLLLLSKVENGTMLSFKRLDKIDTEVSLNAFKDNNPDNELGKSPLDIAWEGRHMTNFGKYALRAQQDVVISTADPVRVYKLDRNTLKLKNEITFDGTGDFMPSKIICTYGVQNTAWDGTDYFVGNGREFVLTNENTFIDSYIDFDDASDVKNLANLYAVLVTEYTDMPIVYFNNFSKKILYNSMIMGEIPGELQFDIEPMAIHPCGAIYREPKNNNRYEPGKLLLIGHDDAGIVKIYHILGSDHVDEETLLNEYSAGEFMTPESASIVNPIDPILYFSKDNVIYTMNFTAESFDAQEYIQLPEGYVVKDMTFNLYDKNSLYIAAENTKEESELKASIFIYDVADKSVGKKLFEGNKAGGSVQALIFKGNGRDNENVVRPSALNFNF